MSIVPSPPPNASATTRGLVSTGAQEFAGAKTLTGTILNGVSTIAEAVTSLVRAVGASLVLRSSLGAGSSDVAVKVGTSETDAGTNASAKLLSVRTGLGGTEVEKCYIRKAGSLVVGNVAIGPTSDLTNVAAGVKYNGTNLGFYNNNSAAGLFFNTSSGLSGCTGNFASAGELRSGFNFGSGVSAGRLDGSGRLDQSGSNEVATPGARTVNKPTGRNAVAAAASSVVITCNQCTATSRVHITPLENAGSNAEFRMFKVTAAAGSFTVALDSAVTYDWPFSWEVAGIL